MKEIFDRVIANTITVGIIIIVLQSLKIEVVRKIDTNGLVTIYKFLL
jgi:hypothetical protein